MADNNDEQKNVEENKTEEPQVQASTQSAPNANKGAGNPEPVDPEKETVVGGSRDGKNQGDAHPELQPANREEEAKDAPADRVVEGSNHSPHVVQHLDRDPNDPRNAAPTPKLPSLDDEGQS